MDTSNGKSNDSKINNSVPDNSTTKSKNSLSEDSNLTNSTSNNSTPGNSPSKNSNPTPKKDSTPKPTNNSTTNNTVINDSKTNVTNNRPTNSIPTNSIPTNSTIIANTTANNTTINNTIANNSTLITTNSTLPEIFSYEEVVKKYKDVHGKCGIEGDKDSMNKCPYDLQCVGYDYCELLFKCNEKDLNRCANNYISDKYFGACNTNEDCLSNNCVDNKCIGRLLTAAVGSGSARIGLELGEKCVKDSDCFENTCRYGKCEMYDSGEYVRTLYGGVCTTIMLVILYCTYFCVFRKNKEPIK